MEHSLTAEIITGNYRVQIRQLLPSAADTTTWNSLLCRCKARALAYEKVAEILGVNPDATMLEVEEAEAAIYNHDLTDVTDIITEILRDVRQNGQQLGQ